MKGLATMKKWIATLGSVMCALWVPFTTTIGADTGTTIKALSSEAAQVTATYTEIMQQVIATMAAGGKGETSVMKDLEAKIAAEVKRAVPELYEVVRTGDRQPAEAAAYALRYAPDPEAATAALIEALGRFDGALANNVGLSIEHLCRNHPMLVIPIEPLTRALDTTQWNQQQKVAQALLAVENQGGLTDPQGDLTAALIPMLANQRVRVYGPARTLLPKLTRQDLGHDAAMWTRWYRTRYGRTIDLPSRIYELVQIIEISIVAGEERFRVGDSEYATLGSTLARLKADAQTAHDLKRKFEIVVQVPVQGIPQDRLMAIANTLVKELFPSHGGGLTISPQSDEFVPFEQAVLRLRRLLAVSTPR